MNARMEGTVWAQAANPAFSVQRNRLPVHYVIHFRRITKQHSLSSLRRPKGLGICTWGTLSRNRKGKIKTKLKPGHLRWVFPTSR